MTNIEMLNILETRIMQKLEDLHQRSGRLNGQVVSKCADVVRDEFKRFMKTGINNDTTNDTTS